jgi:hypothetical protein
MLDGFVMLFAMTGQSKPATNKKGRCPNRNSGP